MDTGAVPDMTSTFGWLAWMPSPADVAETHRLPGWAAWHGRAMVLAWGMLVPVGILAARYFKVVPGQGWPQSLDQRGWWHAHRGLQAAALAIMLLGLWLVRGHAEGASPLARAHALLGWTVCGAAGLQAVGGALRGSKGGPGDPRGPHGDHFDMTRRRRLFEHFHKSLGYLAWIASVATLLIGLALAQAPRWMWLALAAWWLVCLTAAVHWQRERRCIDTYQAIWGIDPSLPGLRRPPIGWGIHRVYATPRRGTAAVALSLEQVSSMPVSHPAADAAAPGLELRGVSKRFGDHTVVQSLDLKVRTGEFMVLLGESGCGKSTTLRMIAGLEPVSGGHILIGGSDVTHAAPRLRDIAMVFQNYALYPHMSVAQNMAFALELARVPAREVSRRVSRAADILGITRLLDRKPSALSGGQRQRVAIGRCIVREPRIFLFDEPLSNLDAKLRSHMRAELATLHRRLGKTTVYVTHDQIEAMTLASRIAIFDKGVVQQVGTPAEVFERPANLFVAAFVGTPAMNLLPAAIAPDGRIQGDGFTLAHPASAIPPGRECTVGIRPHALRECDADSAAITICVDLVEYIGAESVVSGTLARNDGIRVLAALPGQRNDLHGSLLGLAVDTAALHLFDRRTGMNLSH